MRDTGGLLRLMPVRLWGVVLIFLRKSSLTNERSFPGAGLGSGHLPGSIIPAALGRLSKDYEILTSSAEAVIMISHAHTLLNRL